MKAFMSLGVVFLAGPALAGDFQTAVARLPVLPLPYEVKHIPPESLSREEKVPPPDKALLPALRAAAKAFETCSSLGDPNSTLLVDGRIPMKGGVVLLLASSYQPGPGNGLYFRYLMTFTADGRPIDAREVAGSLMADIGGASTQTTIGADLTLVVKHTGHTPTGEQKGGLPEVVTTTSQTRQPLGSDGHFAAVVNPNEKFQWYADAKSGERLRMDDNGYSMSSPHYQAKVGRPLQVLTEVSNEYDVAVVTFPGKPKQLYTLEWVKPYQTLRCRNPDGTSQIFERVK
jgi:hypothetical protein